MTAELGGRPHFNFKAPLDAEAAADPFLSRLMGTPAFARLSNVRFLGGIDYARIPAPNGRPGSRRYTRYQHSLGVARLALLYADLRGLPPDERRLIGAAALLHDIGHAPLSHSLEPVFKEAFGVDHHLATADVLFGRVPLGAEVHALLRDAKLDVERLAAVIEGREEGHDGFFGGPINFDTIEGILRSHTYEKPAPRLSPETVAVAATRRRDAADRDTVDEFWRCKDMVYGNIINCEKGLLADAVCQDAMRREIGRFTRADYLVTERRLFAKLPELRALLTAPHFEREARRALTAPLRARTRRFFTDQTIDFFARDDRARYRQKRSERILEVRELTDERIEELRQDLFNDARRDREGPDLF